MPGTYFVSGIGTGVGKTLVSGILCLKFGASYWKPLQTGASEGKDSDFISSLSDFGVSDLVFPEAYVFSEPVSPHIASRNHNIELYPEKLSLPDTGRLLIVEGAGGLMVPIRPDFLMADLIRVWNMPLILVVSSYLGCINHALLSFYYVQHRMLPVRGVILNGDFDEDVRSVILKHCPFDLLAEIPKLSSIHPQVVISALAEDKIKFYSKLE